MINKELNLLFKEALISSLTELNSLLESRQYIVLWPVEEPEFYPDGTLTGTRMIFKPFVSAPLEVQQIVSKIPQVLKLCEFVVNTGLSAQLVAKEAATPAIEQVYNRLFLPFLNHYISEVGNIEFSSDIFQAEYESMMSFFSLTDIKLMFIVPLLGFNMDANKESIEFAPNLTIKRIPQELKKQLWRDSAVSSSWSKEDVGSLKCQVVFEENVPKTSLFSYTTYPEEIENLQPLLRLVKREPISIMCVLVKSLPWYLGSYTGLISAYLPWATANPLLGRYFSTGYHQWQPIVLSSGFSSQEIENLKNLWSNVDSMRNESRLIRALHRFSFSYDRQIIEDKILDIWVGLELLFPDVIGAKRNASQKKLDAITDFISCERTERRCVNKGLSDSWKLRNEIIHGHIKYSFDPANIKTRTEDILVKSLTKCLKQNILP